MKKSFILLALCLSIDVHATTTYTDYEYVGYTFEEKENDEFNKYERVKLNRFYRELESEVEYLEKSVNSNKKIDETTYKIETLTSINRPEEYDYNQLIVIRGEDNYICNKLIIKLLEEYQNLKINEIEIYNQDKKMKVTSTDVPNTIDENYNTYDIPTSESFIIYFNQYAYVDNLTIKIYFENESSLHINYTIHNTSGLLKISKDITLDNNAKGIIINTLKYDKYLPFLEENKYEYNDITYYYKYDKIYYKHYIPIKEYYTISELTELEGYTYDEKESFNMYKIFNRQIVEPEPETNPEPEATQESESDPETDPEPQIEKIIEYVFVKEAIPCICEEKECTIETKEENNGSTAILDTTKNEQSITNLELIKTDTLHKKEKDQQSSNKVNRWLITGLILFIISIIFTVIHYVNVKRDKE